MGIFDLIMQVTVWLLIKKLVTNVPKKRNARTVLEHHCDSFCFARIPSAPAHLPIYRSLRFWPIYSAVFTDLPEIYNQCSGLRMARKGNYKIEKQSDRAHRKFCALPFFRKLVTGNIARVTNQTNSLVVIGNRCKNFVCKQRSIDPCRPHCRAVLDDSCGS